MRTAAGNHGHIAFEHVLKRMEPLINARPAISHHTVPAQYRYVTTCTTAVKETLKPRDMAGDTCSFSDPQEALNN